MNADGLYEKVIYRRARHILFTINEMDRLCPAFYRADSEKVKIP